MKCPICGSIESKVIDSRQSDKGIRRRRKCDKCGSRFTTNESTEEQCLIVKKKSGSLEPFSHEKLTNRVVIALANRSITQKTVEVLVNDIIADIKRSGRKEVNSSEVGEATLAHLRKFDEIAYIRFASVFLKFNTVDEFTNLVTKLKTQQALHA